mmetsp:Transcript_6677/g.24990  ORF Transcript_6677/g.24990 Transcript_6677/m.24990 type:complete len:659 (-) Transcript_6677:2438-4414(-)
MYKYDITLIPAVFCVCHLKSCGCRVWCVSLRTASRPTNTTSLSPFSLASSKTPISPMPPASRSSKNKRSYNHSKTQQKKNRSSKRYKTHPYRAYVPLWKSLTPHQIHNIKLMLQSIAEETDTIISKQAKAIQINYHKNSNQKEAQDRISNLMENSRFSMPKERGRGLGTGILEAHTILWIEKMNWCRRGLLRFAPYVPSAQQPISENLKRKKKWFRLSQIALKDVDLYDEKSLMEAGVLRQMNSNEIQSGRFNNTGNVIQGDSSPRKGLEQHQEQGGRLTLPRSQEFSVNRKSDDGSKITMNNLHSAKRKLTHVIESTRQEMPSSCELKLCCKLGSVLFEEGRSHRFNMKKSSPIDHFLRMNIGYFKDMKLAFNSAVLPEHALQVVRQLKDAGNTVGFEHCPPAGGMREIRAYVNLIDNTQKRYDRKRVHAHFKILLDENNEVKTTQLERFLEKDSDKHAYFTLLKPHPHSVHSVDMRFKFFSEAITEHIPEAIHALADEAQFDVKTEKLKIPRTKQGVYSFESIRYKEVNYRFENEHLVVDIVNSRDHESPNALAEIEIAPKANVAVMTAEQIGEYFDHVTQFVSDAFRSESQQEEEEEDLEQDEDFGERVGRDFEEDFSDEESDDFHMDHEQDDDNLHEDSSDPSISFDDNDAGFG